MSIPINIYAEELEEDVLHQFAKAINEPYVMKAALMPDAHYGYTLPIGAVVATRDMILPSWVGVDIGCGMAAVCTDFKLHEIVEHRDKIFHSIYRGVPVGRDHDSKASEWTSPVEFSNVIKKLMKSRKGLLQLGSLGGGNHFIEIGYDEQSRIWFIVHSGSRGVGHGCATHYMALASNSDRKIEGNYGFEPDSINGKSYIMDLEFCLQYALANRLLMLHKVEREVAYYCSGSCDFDNLINRNHNHAEYRDSLWIHRKGCTHAELGMLGVIPGNMKDGSYIVEGLGNPDSLYSSSHGAGRRIGRGQAKDTLNLETFVQQMEGITARVDKRTLDEGPSAYKDIHEVMDLQKDLVKILHLVRPLINIKG